MLNRYFFLIVLVILLKGMLINVWILTFFKDIHIQGVRKKLGIVVKSIYEGIWLKKHPVLESTDHENFKPFVWLLIENMHMLLSEH